MTFRPVCRLSTERLPILSGTVARRAEAAVESIAASLLTPDIEAGELPPVLRPIAEATLPNGAAGRALFFGHLSRRADRDDNTRLAERFLDRAMGVVARVPMRPALLGGFGGIGWVAEHLGKFCLEREGDDPLASLDGAIGRRLRHPMAPLDYDLVSGIAGFGIIALERFPRPSAVRCLELVLTRLFERAEQTNGVARWLTRPEHLPPRDRRAFPNGYYVLGLAHGIAAVVVVMAGAVARGTGGARVRELLDESVRFLLSVDQRDDPLPYWTGPGVPLSRGRSAWCHGDPGIGVALLAAARAVAEPEWEREARRILLRAARRPPGESGAVEAGLCHGTAGLAHIFRRSHEATLEPELRTASTYWFERTLELLDEDLEGAGTGGASSIRSGFLTGKAGIGLALLSALEPLEPAWDSVLGISLPHYASGALPVSA